DVPVSLTEAWREASLNAVFWIAASLTFIMCFVIVTVWSRSRRHALRQRSWTNLLSQGLGQRLQLRSAVPDVHRLRCRLDRNGNSGSSQAKRTQVTRSRHEPASSPLRQHVPDSAHQPWRSVLCERAVHDREHE